MTKKMQKLSTVKFNELKKTNQNAQLFYNTITKVVKLNKYGNAVEVKSVESYKKLRLFLSTDHKSGFALDNKGDIESVFSVPNLNRGSVIVNEAVKEGGKTLDCYSIRTKE